MPSFKPKANKKIKICKKYTSTLDGKHKEFVNDFIKFYDLDVLNDWLPTERVVKFIVKEKYEDFIRHTFEGRVCR